MQHTAPGLGGKIHRVAALKGRGFRRAANKHEHLNQGRLKAAAEFLAGECGGAKAAPFQTNCKNTCSAEQPGQRTADPDPCWTLHPPSPPAPLPSPCAPAPPPYRSRSGTAARVREKSPR